MPFLFVVLCSLISGFFDVLPVSSFAHQDALQNLFGINGTVPLFNFFVHLGSLAALIFTCFSNLTALLREQRLLSLPRRRRQGERKFTYELQFVRTAFVTITFSTILFLFFRDRLHNTLVVGLLCILNGVLVLVPEYLPAGNKTAKHMNRLDAAVFGLIGGLGVFSGISRITAMNFYGTMRGVDRTKGCTWALLAAIPAMALLAIADFISFFAVGIEPITFFSFLSYFVGAALSFAGTFGGVTLIRFLSAKVGFVGFGYYSIGVGIFTFFLYLTV